MPGPVSDIMPSLPERMRLLVKSRPDLSDEFVNLANQLEAVCETGNIPKIVGLYAKARRRWCEETGERLI